METATTKAEEAGVSASTATSAMETAMTKAEEASASASAATSAMETATTKAEEAGVSASTATSAAQTATAKAGEASTSAGTATNAMEMAKAKAEEADSSASRAEEAANRAESVVGIGVATEEKAGIVKASQDVTVAPDGTLRINTVFKSKINLYVGETLPEIRDRNKHTLYFKVTDTLSTSNTTENIKVSPLMGIKLV